MGHVTTVMGILVLLIGIIGLVSWVNVYQQAGGALSTLSSVESGARQTAEIAKSVSWIPFVGSIAGTIGSGAEFTAQTASSIRMTIILYIVSNALIFVAFIFIGIALIDTGTGYHKIRNVLRDTREYLRKEREKK
jgi:flagellar biosynthesis protein FlhB